MKQKHFREVLAFCGTIKRFNLPTPGFAEKLESAISPDVPIFNNCFLYELCIFFCTLSSGTNHFEI